ncbi:MAG: hypothetical protein JXA92_10490 [candidate division Zixibacteria bacterium]|nr:hypothetical protein [candidate division Zixibacteria bacterium]
MVKRLLIISLVLFGGRVGAGAADTTDFKTDHLLDSVPPVSDTVRSADSLTEAQKAEARFMERYKKLKEEKQAAVEPPLNYYDSLMVYFISSRLNRRRLIDRSFYHDAGDYFRFDPGYFVLESQTTPTRKTVQPYGLTGDRLNVLVKDFQLKPFEHVLEPDGMIDFNDIPTALDQAVYILPGPVGALFGGDGMVATLMTRPQDFDTTAARSTFLVDKGTFGYSYARGRFSKKFIRGRTIDMSIGYRNADGQFFGSTDDAYHYYGDFYFPLGQTCGVRTTGQLYSRENNLWYRYNLGGTYIKRNRFDRSARVSFFAFNPNRTRKYELAYRYLRQGSDINQPYKGRFNLSGHELVLGREWFAGETVFKAELSGGFQEYDDGFESFQRFASSAAFNLARLKKGWRYVLKGGARHDDAFGLSPFAVGMLFKDTERWLLMFSAGYNERSPSMLELNLREQSATLYRLAGGDYTDRGNKALIPERQLVGNATVQWGTLDNNLGLEITGGRIFEGIDWVNTVAADSLSYLFEPQNGDINFVNTTLSGNLGLKDFLRLYAGGAYHFLEYENFEDKAYTPEYEAFSGLELHLFWTQKLIDLFAYGEIVFVGPYDGYDQDNIGNAVINAKLSFRMGSFRFHYVFQNVLATQYNGRDYYLFPGRYSYYGFTWDFLD